MDEEVEMKTKIPKLFGVALTLVLVVSLFGFAVPVAASGVDTGVVDLGVAVETADLAAPIIAPDMDVGAGVAVETADLAVMNSEVLLIETEQVPVSASTADMSLWLALGVTLLTLGVALRRKLQQLSSSMIISLRRISGNTGEGAKMGGGPNKFILRWPVVS